LKTSFIDKRKKLLESFLIKISSQTVFGASEAFNAFLHNPSNYKKQEKEIKIPSLQEIATLYQEVYREFTYFHPSLQQKSEFEDILKDFSEVHAVLTKVKKLARLNSAAFLRYQESFSSLMTGIKTITPLFLNTKSLNLSPKENFVNPYIGIRDWLRSDILDVECVIEGINKYKQIEEDIRNLEVKIEKKKKTLEEIQGGKRSLSQRLFNKTQENIANEEEKSINELEEVKDALEKISAISAGKLLINDIPKFKQQKIYKICATMRNYSMSTVQEYQEIAEQVLQIEESLGH
jgi:hypothetical protein